MRLPKYQLRNVVNKLSNYIYVCLIGGIQLPMQSMPITTNVVSSNPAHVEVYSIQHYGIKFVSYLWHVGGFLWVLRSSFIHSKNDRHDITETLLKVALNTIILTSLFQDSYNLPTQYRMIGEINT